jgi:hypothetical protein
MNLKNQTLLLAAAAVTIFNFQSCSKYEDNSGLQLRSKTGRLTGEWEVVKINGQNPEAYLNNNSYSSPNYQVVISNVSMEWEFEKDEDFKLKQSYDRTVTYSFGSGYTNTYTSTENYSYKGEWEWEDNKEDLEIEYDNYTQEFEILKLTNKELTLEDENGVEWEFEKDN